jgi:hypothetical protein
VLKRSSKVLPKYNILSIRYNSKIIKLLTILQTGQFRVSIRLAIGGIGGNFSKNPIKRQIAAVHGAFPVHIIDATWPKWFNLRNLAIGDFPYQNGNLALFGSAKFCLVTEQNIFQELLW